MASEFTWRKLDDKDRKELEKRVEGLLEDFGKRLDAVKEKAGEVFVEREKFIREEKECEQDKEFRKIFFDNVPRKKGDCVIAEKGEWT